MSSPPGRLATDDQINSPFGRFSADYMVQKPELKGKLSFLAGGIYETRAYLLPQYPHLMPSNLTLVELDI